MGKPREIPPDVEITPEMINLSELAKAMKLSRFTLHKWLRRERVVIVVNGTAGIRPVTHPTAQE